MQRREFGSDSNGQFIEKETGDSTHDLKTVAKQGANMYKVARKELEIGLQAANKMVNIQTQTYYNRSVNAIN